MLESYPHELSGWSAAACKAIAMALTRDPKLVIADVANQHSMLQCSVKLLTYSMICVKSLDLP